MAFKYCMRSITALLLAALFAAPAAADQTKIVAFGDSLMAGYELAPGEAFPARLQAALRDEGYDAAVVNAGVSGDTTSDGRARLDWSVPDGTDIVILELGANDMLRGIAPQTVDDNLDAMVMRLKERDIRVLLAGMVAAPNLGKDYAQAFDSIFPDLAKEHDVALYPFFLDGVATQGQFLLNDGMHPNVEGVKRIVEGILPSLERMLDQRGNEG